MIAVPQSDRKHAEDQLNVQMMPMELIFADDQLNCRGPIVPYDVLDLAKSIEKNGLQQPISVQPYILKPPYKYRIILGHRRFKAFQVLKYEKIPAIIKEGLTEVQVRVLNLQENLERKDLNIMQEALAIEKFKRAGYTMHEVAQLVGMSTGWVQVRFTLLELEPEIQEAAAAGFVTQEQIKDLSSIPSKDARFAAVKAIKESRMRGEKRAIKVKKPKRNLLMKKQRDRNGIFEMMDLILDTLGSSFATRCLAWAAGEISDLELYRDIKDIADEKGIPFVIPTSDVSRPVGMVNEAYR